MLSSKPLFPGRDYHHQLTLILDVLGTPTLDEFYAITTRRSRDYIRALPFRKRRPFATLFPNANPLAVDFLTKTLVCVLPIVLRNKRPTKLHLCRHSIPKSVSLSKTRWHILTWRHTCVHPPGSIFSVKPNSDYRISTTQKMSPLPHPSTPSSSNSIVSN